MKNQVIQVNVAQAERNQKHKLLLNISFLFPNVTQPEPNYESVSEISSFLGAYHPKNSQINDNKSLL